MLQKFKLDAIRAELEQVHRRQPQNKSSSHGWAAVEELLAALEQAQQENTRLREFFLSWILRAYESRKREGWEDGMTEDELTYAMLDILFNYNADPGLPQHKWKVDHLRKMPPVRSEQALDATDSGARG